MYPPGQFGWVGDIGLWFIAVTQPLFDAIRPFWNMWMN
ncbi:hypothetical protein E143388_07881 [Rhodococcus opacus]|nr:hypothetical protein E143388_07881 [Rhodococcus opacus]